MFFKKVMELTENDIKDILSNVPTKELNDEIFSRDAKIIVQHLNENKKLELLQQLLMDYPPTPEIEEELKYHAKRYNLTFSVESPLDVEVIITKILKKYSISQLLAIISNVTKGPF